MRRTELLALLAAFLVAGCGSDDESIRTLTGDRVGRMAEAQLESEHPGMSPGSLMCQDLVLELDATTRCTRTARLSKGRIVRVNGTVRVTSLDDGGRLHVKLDDRVVGFGIDGDHLARRISDRLDVAGTVTCPDLDGVAGAAVSCEVGTGTVVVTAIAVDDDEYDVDYTIGPLQPD